MGQRTTSLYAEVTVAQTKLVVKGDFASGMGEKSTKSAAETDVQTMLSKEECALNMGQRSSDAVVKDAQIMLFKEGCVSMGQRSNANSVV